MEIYTGGTFSRGMDGHIYRRVRVEEGSRIKHWIGMVNRQQNGGD